VNDALLISRKRLLAALDVSRYMLQAWNKDRLLAPAEIKGHEQYYSTEEVNNFLAQRLVTPNKKRLTIEAILAGDRLIKIGEAADELGVHYDTAATAVNEGKLFGVKLGTHTKVLLSSVHAYKQRLNPTFISSDALAALFKISVTSLLNWKEGPRRTIILGVTRFLEEHVNDFLANCSHNLPVVPTLDDLKSKKIELLRPEEAAVKYGFSVAALCNYASVQRIWLSQDRLRIVASSLHALTLAEPPPADLQSTYSAEQVAQIFQVPYVTVIKWIASGELTSTQVSRVHKIAHDTLVAFIKPRIRRDDDPERWIINRLSSQSESLLTFNETVAIIGGPKRVAAIADTNLSYIKSGKSSRSHFFTRQSVLEFYANDEVMEGVTTGNLFGVHCTMVSQWRHDGQLTCTAHDHDPSEQPRKACLLRVLAGALHRTDYEKWFDAYHSRQCRLLDLSAAAEYTNISEQTLARYVEEDKVGFIMTPAGPKFSPLYHLRSLKV